MVNAQTITKATSQSWAGGVCCATGTNYVVDIELVNKPENIEIQEIILAGYGPISGNLWPPMEQDQKKISITFNTSNNVHHVIYDSYPDIKKSDDEIDCAALIVLRIDGKLSEMRVESFEALMYIAYP